MTAIFPNSSAGSRSPRIQGGLFLLLVLAAILAAYSNTLHSPFLLDDDGHILHNPRIRIQSLSPEAIAEVWDGPHISKRRKIPYLSFALNYYWGGYQVFGYHLFNISVHLACTLLAFCFFWQTTGTSWLERRYRPYRFPLAWTGAMIWGLHPIQINAVTYLVQRMTSLAVFFGLIALVAWLAGRSRWLQGARLRGALLWLGAGMAWALGLYCKEHVAILPVLILVQEWLLFKRGELKMGWYWPALGAGFLLAAVLYYLGPTPWKPIAIWYENRDFTLSQRLMTEARVLWHYLSLFYLPLAQRFSLLHQYPLSTGLFSPLTTFFSILAWAGAIGLAAWKRKRWPVFSWMLGWYLCAHLIESTVLPLQIIFEHRMYLPSLGLALGTALLGAKPLISRFSPRPVAVAMVLFCLAAVLGTATFARNMDFKDPVSLYRAELKRYPRSQRIRLHLALALNQAGRFDAGGGLLRKLAQEYPRDIVIQQNWYNFLVRVGNHLQKARPVLNRLVSLVQNGYYQPRTDAIALKNLADLLFEQQRYKASLFFAEQLLADYPRRSDFWLHKGVCHVRLADWVSAHQAFEAAWELNPDAPGILYWYGWSLIRAGDPIRGCQLLRQAARHPRAGEAAQHSQKLLQRHCP